MSLTKIGSIGINTGIAFAGVTTIATLNASDNVLSVGGTVNFVSDVSIGGTVSIAGTLTYEDVTNVDAVGLITARDGIKVGSGITLSVDGDGFFTGVITATSYSGIDLSAVTGATGDFSIADKIIHTGDTDTAIRFPSADTITAETGGTERLRINSTGQTIVGDSVTQLSTSSERPFQVHSVNGPKIAIGRNDTSIVDGNTIGGLEFYGNDNNGTFVNTASIIVDADGTHGDDDKPTRMLFYTTADNASSATEKLRIESGGGIKLPVVGTTIPVGGLLHHTNNNLYVRGGTEGLILGNQDNTNTMHINDNNYIKFETNNGSERLRINSDGNMLLRGGSVSYLVLGSSGDSGFDATISNNMNWIRGNGDNLQLNCADSGFIAFETNGTERMRIHDSLYTTFGTTSTYPRDGGISIEGGVGHMVLSRSNTNSEVMIRFERDNGTRGDITVSTSTTYNTTSDYRLKENITDLSDAITRLKKITPRRFNFISDENKQLVDGFIAHEVSEAVPEAVKGTKDQVATADDVAANKATTVGEPIHQQVDYSKYVPLLTAALQEAVAKIETLETEVAVLKSQLNN